MRTDFWEMYTYKTEKEMGG